MWQMKFDKSGSHNHTQSVMSHSHLNNLGEFHFPKSRASLRLVLNTIPPVSADVCKTCHGFVLFTKDLK